jgi:hypothetical protein
MVQASGGFLEDRALIFEGLKTAYKKYSIFVVFLVRKKKLIPIESVSKPY